MVRIKEGFKGERFVSLPENLLREYSKDPLIENLYVRKIGFFPKVKYHYVQKESGTDYAMLIYCVDGKGKYHINGKTYQIRQKQYIFIPPHVPYSFEADIDEPWTIYWLHFSGKLVHSIISPGIILSDEHSRQQVRIELFEEIYNSFSMGYIKEYFAYSAMYLYSFLSTFIFQEQFRDTVFPDISRFHFLCG